MYRPGDAIDVMLRLILKEEASKSRWRARKDPSAWGQQTLVCCVGDAALLRWTDCCALLQGP
jgi:hypothetical protein